MITKSFLKYPAGGASVAHKVSIKETVGELGIGPFPCRAQGKEEFGLRRFSQFVIV